MNETSTMKQYRELKQSLRVCADNTLLVMRVGDFYELMYEDAEIAATILGRMTVMRHAKGEEPVPMIGFPYHELMGRVSDLAKAGHTVVVAEDGLLTAFAKVESGHVVRYETGSVQVVPKLLRDYGLGGE